MGWLQGWFGYGLGAGVAKAIFGEDKPSAKGPIRQQTEEEIRADERRFDEDAKRLDAADAARKKHSSP
jgi:hypothetical protein